MPISRDFRALLKTVTRTLLEINACKISEKQNTSIFIFKQVNLLLQRLLFFLSSLPSPETDPDNREKII